VSWPSMSQSFLCPSEGGGSACHLLNELWAQVLPEWCVSVSRIRKTDGRCAPHPLSRRRNGYVCAIDHL